MNQLTKNEILENSEKSKFDISKEKFINANAFFTSHQYLKAISAYQSAARLSPYWLGDYRLWGSLGFCYARLNQTAKAVASLEKATTLPNCQPEVFKALLDILSNPSNCTTPKLSSQTQRIAKFAATLKKGLRKFPENPHFRLYLADVLFYSEDPINSSKIACSLEAEQSFDKRSKSRLLYLQGRTLHKTKQLKKAYKKYKESLKLDEKNVCAQFGLAQISFCFGRNVAGVIKALRAICESYEEFWAANKLLGFVYASRNELPQARAFLEKSLKIYPNDPQTLLLLAQLSEKQSPIEAIKWYNHAIEATKESGEPVPIPLYNNLAVLYHQNRLPEQAKLIFGALSTRIDSLNSSPALHFAAEKPLIRQVVFNKALFEADSGQREAPLAAFERLRAEEPGDIDSLLSIALLSETEAEKRAKLDEVFARGSSELPHNLMMGQLYRQLGETKKAKQCFKNIVALNPAHTVGYVSMGNLLMDSDKPENTKTAYKNYIRKALIKDSNAYAINSLGVLLASKGATDEAKRVFECAKEAAKGVSVFWENLGHAFSALKAYGNAVVMYEKALSLGSRGSARPTPLLFNLSKAYFLKGNRAEAKKILEEVLSETPKSGEALFNLALVTEDEAIEITKIPSKKRSVYSLHNALELLQSALQNFESIAESEDLELREKAQPHVVFCREELLRTEQSVRALVELAKNEKEMALQKERDYLALRKKRVEREERLRVEEATRLKAKNEKALEAASRLKTAREKWILMDKEIKKSRKRKRPLIAKEHHAENDGKREHSEEEEEKESNNSDKLIAAEIVNEPNMFENYVEKHSDDELDYVPHGEQPDDHTVFDSDGDSQLPNLDPALEFYQRRKTAKKVIHSEDDEAI